MVISCFFLFIGGKKGLEQLVETRLYVWQGFVVKNPGWSPIRELSTPADTEHLHS